MFEQRKNARYEFSGDKLEFTLSPFSTDEIREAGVINFSETGLCLLSVNPLSVGQEITIRDFMGSSSRTAVVIWIEKCDDMFLLDKSEKVSYRIGLSFV